MSLRRLLNRLSQGLLSRTQQPHPTPDAPGRYYQMPGKVLRFTPRRDLRLVSDGKGANLHAH